MSPDCDAPPPSVLRDPLIPLDLGGWLYRVVGVLRDNAALFLGIGAVFGVFGVAFRVAMMVAWPGLDEIGRQLVIAGRDTPGNYVDRWTVFRIAYLPMVPTFVVFTALITVTNAIVCGAAYHRVIRRANGQPTPLAAALRAARPRVLPFIGWYLLAVLGTLLAIGLVFLPAAVFGGRWPKVAGALAAIVVIVLAFAIALQTIFGVVFLERRGLRRCLGLVRGRRLGLAAWRTVLLLAAVGLYAAAAEGVLNLLLAPFGGRNTLPLPWSALEYLAGAVLNLPLFGVTIAATLVTYAELRHREDPSTGTRALAAEVPL